MERPTASINEFSASVNVCSIFVDWVRGINIICGVRKYCKTPLAAGIDSVNAWSSCYLAVSNCRMDGRGQNFSSRVSTLRCTKDSCNVHKYQHDLDVGLAFLKVNAQSPTFVVRLYKASAISELFRTPLNTSKHEEQKNVLAQRSVTTFTAAFA